jgi:diaminopimelate epimerase
VARFAFDAGLGRSGEVRIRTAVGPMRARRHGAGIELAFGRIATPEESITLEAAGRVFTGRRIVAGVPHFVTEVERVEWVPVREWGAALRHHPRFEPAGANVDFVARLGPGRVAMRTYERGVEGETLACGSGAMASALWAATGGDAPPVSVVTAGGDELVVGWTAVEGGYDVSLAGPAEVAFAGTWDEPVLATASAD